MQNGLVSVIIPCYKQAHLLSETIQSVLDQTYSNWECIIVNDGSPDNTEEVVRKICKQDSRIRLLNQNNQGPAIARNNGIYESNGEFILPLDSDDLIAPTYIEKAVNYFNKNPDTTLVYCKADFFGYKKGVWKLPQYKYEIEIWNNVIFCSAVFKRNDYDKTNGYNPNMISGNEDWDFWLSLLKPESKVYRIEEILFHYRKGKETRTNKAVAENRMLMKQIYLNHKDIYKEYCSDIIILKNIEKKYNRIQQLYLFKILKKIIY